MENGRRVRGRSARNRAAAREEVGRRVTRTSAYESEQEEAENLGTVRFPAGTEPAFIRVGAGATYNLGNYESLRLDVSVTLPCLPEDVEHTYRQASEFVAEKLQEEELSWLGSKHKSGR